MRLANLILRGGHLSERDIVEVCMTGDRPVHLDRCDICAERAVELGRWLDEVRIAALAEADAAFSPDHLTAQQHQIMRRLEQLDQPARVIAFPQLSKLEERLSGRRRVAPGWVAVAAAAGLVLGVVGGQVSARLAGHPAAAAPAVATTEPTVDPVRTAELDRIDSQDMPNLPSVNALNGMTPRQVPTSEGNVVLASYPGGIK